jgi:hypothetical protein
MMKRKKEKKMSIKKKREIKKTMYEKRKNNNKVNSSVLSNALGISKVKIQTHLSNHVQYDNEDFHCASGSLFAICTCPPISKCVYFSLPLLDITLFSNGLFDESR